MSKRIAIVTGGGSGIGRASARLLAKADWTVVVVGRNQATLEATATLAEIGQIVPIVGDITDEAAVDALFATVGDRFGRVDLLFNNAGCAMPEASFGDVTCSDFRTVIDTNVIGAFLCAKAAFRQMADQEPRGGRIINNGSVAAHSPRPFASAYTVSKHAVTGLTRAIALEGRSFGISCGQIDIGNAATDMAQEFAVGTRQADGRSAIEPLMDVDHAAASVVHMASLPPEANILNMTIMATNMPFVGRG